MEAKESDDWLVSSAAQANQKIIGDFAAAFAGFYLGLVAAGLSEAAAIQLTQAYITAIVAGSLHRQGES